MNNSPGKSNGESKSARSDGEGPKAAADGSIQDPHLLAQNIAQAMEEGGRALREMLDRSANPKTQSDAANDTSDVANLFAEVAKVWLNAPDDFATRHADLMRQYAHLWDASARRFAGEESEPVVEPAPGDKRFRDPEWSQNHFFDFVKQFYLITTRWAEEVLAESKDLDPHVKHRAQFFLRLLGSAASPSNFPFTNPEVLRETLATNGENLRRGLSQFTKDLESSGDQFNVTQSDPDAFEVGVNLALSPGKVIYQNEIMQLLHYKPSTETVYARPLLIVPPWINKFYVLDLTPEKSFIAHAVAQGFSVFVVSWVNPDARCAKETFETYMRKGVLKATEITRKVCDGEKVNVLGYCVGGTLVGTALAYAAAEGLDVFASATFLTTQLDFTEAGDLMVFVDEEQIAEVEAAMAERGYLDGSHMAQAFNMLRPRDLIWPYIVNNYLLGKKPFPFDLLYWNADSTRMPAANHAFYLRQFYHENRFARGEMEMGGHQLDLGEVDLPIYELATIDDHIAPAASVYRGAKLFGSDNVNYVLSGSGHIAGVINPPHKNKYQFWTNAAGIEPGDLTDWLAGAQEHPGSWWPDWIGWLHQLSGEQVPARKPGKGPYKKIENAPGSYVRVRS